LPSSERAKQAEQRLKAVQDKARRKKMGPPLNLSDTALNQAAEVREVDKASAEDWWDRNAPPEARGLLRARVEDDA
jgi:hypothetical protein